MPHAILRTIILMCLCQCVLAQESFSPEPVKSTITQLPGQDVWEIREFDLESEEVIAFRYVLQNKIDLLARSTINRDPVAQQFVYRYRLANGLRAIQNIDYFWICCVPLQVFVIPPDDPFPKKTGNTAQDEAAMLAWHKRSWAEAKFVVGAGKRYLQSPATWRPSLKQSDGSAGYGWLALANNDIPKDKRIYGMPPDIWSDSFAFARPELPSVRIAKIQGFSNNDQFPGSYNIDTDDPKLLADIEAIARADGRWLPVLAPVFPVAEPFNAAAFTRQLWSEIEDKWYRDDDYSRTMLAPDVFEQLQREFQLLLIALEANNTDAAKAGIARVLAYMAQLTAPDSVTPGNAGQEQAANDTAPLPTTRAPVTDPDSADVATRSIHRVAARALVFNLAYLQKRLSPESNQESK